MSTMKAMVRQEAALRQMHAALTTITKYQTPDQLRRSSNKQWGLDYEEALEYSYENIQQTARNGLRGIRLRPLSENQP